MKTLRRAPLTLALAMALTACGGGGGTKSNSPVAPAQPPQPPPSQPDPPPTGGTCEDPRATNTGGPKPCAYRYTGVGDNLLVTTNAASAHEAGFTGKGVKVGVLDGQHQGAYAPLDGRVAWYRDYTGKSDYDNYGHGAVVATALAGRAVGSFGGGVAPGADIYWGVNCYNNWCTARAAEDAIADMTAAGVRLFNWSIGGDFDNEDYLRQQAEGYARSLHGVVDVDGLLVAAAGNDSKPDPSTIALMPRFKADWNGHLLAVAAVTVDGKGAVTGLESYSNACGRAAQWCLAAPGLVAIPAVKGTQFQGLASGTSLAAPAVTGAAALVWQAFPWMSAANVQQTILTTASDLGAPGVDAVYGWGLLDVEKAVHGPGAFVGSFTADVPHGSYVFGNDIHGTGGLVKTGAGTLTLAGRNTYTGLTHVQRGYLFLANGTGGSVRVASGATFQGAGRIGGDFRADAGATTAIAVGKPLQVQGHATFGGALALLAPASAYQVGEVERLVDYGSRTGTFSSVVYGSGFFYTAELDYGANALDAKLTRTSAAATATARGASATVVEGAAIADSLLDYAAQASRGTGNDSLVELAGQLASVPTVARAEASLASLAAEVHGTARAVAVQQAVAADQLLSDRVATLHPANAGAWVSATAQDGAFERRGYADADWRSTGLTVGVDHDFGTLVAGAALGTGRSRADLDAVGGDFDADTLGLNLYARLPAGPGYVSATFGYGRATVDTRRTLLVGDQALGVSARHRDTTWSTRVEAGRNLAEGVTPFAAAGWIAQRQGAFAESGAQGLGLAAGADTASIRYGELGLRLSLLRDNLAFRGLVAGRWLSGDTRAGFGGWFSGAPEAKVSVSGQRVPGHAARAAVGLDYARTPRAHWSVDVGAEQGAGDSSNAYITAGYRYAF